MKPNAAEIFEVTNRGLMPTGKICSSIEKCQEHIDLHCDSHGECTFVILSVYTTRTIFDDLPSQTSEAFGHVPSSGAES